MVKQAIWVAAVITRYACQVVIDTIEHDRPDMDDPLTDAGLFWDPAGLLGDGPIGDVKTGLIDVKTAFSAERDSEHV